MLLVVTTIAGALAATLSLWSLIAARGWRATRRQLREERAFAEHERRYVASAVSSEVAHELASCLLFLRDLLAQDAIADDDRAAGRHEIARLEGLLKLLRRARLPEEPQVVAGLRQVIEGAVTRLNHVDAQRLTLDIPPSLTVRAGVAGLQLVLVCVLRNAIAAAGDGRVLIRARQKSDGVVIEIEDDGPGVPEAVRETLFRSLATLKPGAIGLGMTTALRVARDRDWRLSTTRQGGRTIFRIDLPIDHVFIPAPSTPLPGPASCES